MRPTRRAVLGAVATASLAGCLGGGDGGGTDDRTDTSTDTATDTPTATPTATDADDGSATVQVRSHQTLGEILVGPEGLTLYMFDQDTKGSDTSACGEDCVGAWPPLTVEDSPTAGGDVGAELTTFERDDGSTQVAANGWPLYYYANDGEPGDANGQGVGDVWWVLDPDGVPQKPTNATETGGSAY